MPVVLLVSLYGNTTDGVAAAASLARRRSTRLELIAVASPWREVLWSFGALAPLVGASTEEVEVEMSRRVSRMLALVPADVPVGARILRGTWRQARRQAASL